MGRFSAGDLATFRDERTWAFLPRLGAGIERTIWRCWTVGLEWAYLFPGRPVYYGPKMGPSGRDQNMRWEKVRGNQLALSVNWWFW